MEKGVISTRMYFAVITTIWNKAPLFNHRQCFALALNMLSQDKSKKEKCSMVILQQFIEDIKLFFCF
jgi:hypothetical protein